MNKLTNQWGIVVNNNSITEDAVSTVAEMDGYLRNEKVQKQLNKIAEELIPEISQDSPYAVRDISVLELVEQAPESFGSIRVAVFYPGVETKIERHLNSTQYLYSVSGNGETRVLRDVNWEIDEYGSCNDNYSLKDRWHLVNEGAWHQSVAKGEKPWIVIAVHTAKDVIDDYEYKPNP